MEKWLDDLYDLCETVSKELSTANEKIRAAGGKLSAGDLDYLDKITHTMKSAKTIIAMEEAEERNGESGYYPYMGGYRSYDDGMPESRRVRSGARRRDAMGRYSRENRGYSRDDAKSDMVDDLRELMHDAPDERTRMMFKEFIREIENA